MAALALYCLSVSAASAQTARIYFADCTLQASILDFAQSYHFGKDIESQCTLEKEVAPNVWRKIQTFSQVDPTGVVRYDGGLLADGTYRVSFLLPKADQVGIAKFEETSTVLRQKSNLLISNPLVISETTRAKCDEVYYFGAQPAGDPEAVRIYPNPVAERLFLSSPNNGQLQSADIYDSVGKLVLRQFFSADGKAEYTIDVAQLKAGTYWLEVRVAAQESSTSKYKLIVL